MHVLRDRIGLTVNELRELAEQILHRDVESLRTLTDEDVKRMLDALEGAALVMWTLSTRA